MGSWHPRNTFLVSVASGFFTLSASSPATAFKIGLDGAGLLVCLLYLGSNKNPKVRIRRELAEHDTRILEGKKFLRQAEENIKQQEVQLSEWTQAEKQAQLEAILAQKKQLEQEIARLTEEQARLKLAIVSELEEHSEKLKAAQAEVEANLSQREQDLEALEKKLRKDAQAMVDKVLEAAKEMEQDYQGQISVLEDEIAERNRQLYLANRGKRPDGFSEHETMASRIQDELERVQCPCNYVASWRTDNTVFVRLKPPNDVKALSKAKSILVLLKVNLRLVEMPDVQAIPGCFEFRLKIEQAINLQPVDYGWSPEQVNGHLVPVQIEENRTAIEPKTFQIEGELNQNSSIKKERGSIREEIEPETTTTEFKTDSIELLAKKYSSLHYVQFNKPEVFMPSNGELEQIEIDWIVYCFLHEQTVVTNAAKQQKVKYGLSVTNTIREVYGCSRGASRNYEAAKGKVNKVIRDNKLKEVKNYLKKQRN